MFQQISVFCSAKQEWRHEKNIYNFVLAVVKKGLGHYDLTPNLEFGDDPDQGVLKNKYSHSTGKNDFSDRPGRMGNTGFSSYSDAEIDLLFNSMDTGINRTAAKESFNHPFDEESGQKEVYRNKAVRPLRLHRPGFRNRCGLGTG